MKNSKMRLIIPRLSIPIFSLLACTEVDDFDFETDPHLGSDEPNPNSTTSSSSGGGGGLSDQNDDEDTDSESLNCNGPASASPYAEDGVRDEAYCIDCSDFPQGACRTRTLETIEGITPPGDVIFAGKLIYGLAASASELFFTEYGYYNRNGYSSPATGTLHAVPLSGGTVTTISDQLPGPLHVSIGAHGVKIVTEDLDAGSPVRTLWQVDPQGHRTQLNVTESIVGGELLSTNDTDDFYFSSQQLDTAADATYSIQALAADGSTRRVADNINARCIESDQDFVYFSGSAGTYRVALDGSDDPAPISFLEMRRLERQGKTLWATSETGLYSMPADGSAEFEQHAKFSNGIAELMIHDDRFFISVFSDAEGGSGYLLHSGLLDQPSEISSIGDEPFLTEQAPWTVTDEGLFYVYADSVYHVPHDELLDMME